MCFQAGVTLSSNEGLGHYLKECLMRCDEDSSLPSGALNRLLELAQAPQGDGKTCLISTLVLQSPLLRQFSTETSIRIVTKHIKERYIFKFHFDGRSFFEVIGWVSVLRWTH